MSGLSQGEPATAQRQNISTLEPASTQTATAAKPGSRSAQHHVGLDGLRGLALLVVLGYHGDIPATKGAFLALSQFFTLSGFFITGLLLRRHLRPGGNMRSFWTRRARRLMPAAFLALAVIVVFGATVATRQQAASLPGDVAAAATWTANWRFILNGQSYVNLFAAPSPVQHFWSLAIEEQFYLLFPLALWALVRFTRSLPVIAGVIVGAAIASSTWMFFLYERGASLDRIYYGTDTRMSELLVGGALAVILMHLGTEFSERTRWIIGVVGTVAFVASIWCWVEVPLADGPIWRGGFFVFSLLSCALILTVVAGKGPVTWIYSIGLLALIGRMCYGIYLFHWPIFLWLDEDRTGLSRWPLFALRLAVTFAVAALSYYFVERPILGGASLGLNRRRRLALAPIIAIALIVAVVLTVNRSAVDPLATLNTSASNEMPRAPGDGVLDLLVIPNRAGDPTIAQLESTAGRSKAVRLTVASPFACTGGLVSTEHGRTCANWAREWPALISAHNPDAVLVYADSWAGTSLAQLGGASPPAQVKSAVAVMNAGFDFLTSRRAPVVWAQPGMSYVDALRKATQPFYQSMLQILAQRDDTYEVTGGQLPDPATLSTQQYATRSAAVLLSNASLHQRDAGQSLPRVLIVGDSQALSLGYGLDRWTAQNKRALVWNHGVEACGVAIDGEPRGFGSANAGSDRCEVALRSWPQQVREFRPDVVIVLSSLADIQDRRLPGSTHYSSLGDPDFDASLVGQYEHAVDVLSATGAKVIWMDPPCTSIKLVAGEANPYSAARLDHVTSDILPRVVRDRPDKVVRFDLAAVLCPHGKPLQSVSGAGELRPDGVHFSVGGALWFANTYGDRLLKLGGI